MTSARLFAALAVLWLAACTAQPTPTFHAEGKPKLLSEWGQLSLAGGKLSTAKDVQHYKLRTPLFSDYAQKHRTVWIPEGTSATYHEVDVFDFPVGTVITKTFYYEVPEGSEKLSGQVLKQAPTSAPIGTAVDLKNVRLIETRILARREDGWIALPYVWNDEQTEAQLKRTGDLINLTLVDENEETPFPYQVPNTNQCAGCHATNNTTREIQPIGPKARHLDVMAIESYKGVSHQLEIWNAKGFLSDFELETIFIADRNLSKEKLAELEASLSPNWFDPQARAYLDINCSHCHSKTGPADTSGLHLTPDTPLGPHLGLCKTPIAAGRGTGDRDFGIVPGDADASIMHYRIASNKADIMMPELGRSLVHVEGTKLIADWINDMDGSCNG